MVIIEIILKGKSERKRITMTMPYILEGAFSFLYGHPARLKPVILPGTVLKTVLYTVLEVDSRASYA
jgi:hypothetical protein